MYAMSRGNLWFRDLARAAGTNRALRRVVADESLWAFGLPDPIGSGSSGNEKFG
jgi:hypothetical protein